MQRGLILVMTLVIAFTVFTSASAHAQECSALFSETSNKSTTALKPTRPRNRPTVKVLGIVTNDKGETFYRFRRLLEEWSWYSYYAPNLYDRQGSPYRVFEVLGFELARVLGFSWNKAGEILAPTPLTLNGRIEDFNVFLRQRGLDPIPLRYYQQNGTHLETFLERRSLNHVPIAASRDHHTIHDYSFHIGEILAPRYFSRLLEIQARLTSEFVDLLPSSDPLANGLQKFSSQMIDSMSTVPNAIGAQGPKLLDLQKLTDSYRAWDPMINAKNWPSHAKWLTPAELFRRHIVFELNRDLFELDAPLPKKYLAIFNRVVQTLPESQRTVWDLGLRDFETTATTFQERAAELQLAAREYLAN